MWSLPHRVGEGGMLSCPLPHNVNTRASLRGVRWDQTWSISLMITSGLVILLVLWALALTVCISLCLLTHKSCLLLSFPKCFSSCAFLESCRYAEEDTGSFSLALSSEPTTSTSSSSTFRISQNHIWLILAGHAPSFHPTHPPHSLSCGPSHVPNGSSLQVLCSVLGICFQLNVKQGLQQAKQTDC